MMVDVREYNSNSPGPRGSSTGSTLTPTSRVEISLGEMRESFVEIPPCDIRQGKQHVKASAERVQELDKGGTIGGGDFLIGHDESQKSTNNNTPNKAMKETKKANST